MIDPYEVSVASLCEAIGLGTRVKSGAYLKTHLHICTFAQIFPAKFAQSRTTRI